MSRIAEAFRKDSAHQEFIRKISEAHNRAKQSEPPQPSNFLPDFNPDRHDLYFNGQLFVWIADHSFVTGRSRIVCLNEDWSFGMLIERELFDREYWLIQNAPFKAN